MEVFGNGKFHRRANGMPEDILKSLTGHSPGGGNTSRYNILRCTIRGNPRVGRQDRARFKFAALSNVAQKGVARSCRPGECLWMRGVVRGFCKAIFFAPSRPPGRCKTPGRGGKDLLIARGCLSASSLGNADVASYLILCHGVDNQFEWTPIISLMEEDRLVDGQILPLDASVIDGQ